VETPSPKKPFVVGFRLFKMKNPFFPFILIAMVFKKEIDNNPCDCDLCPNQSFFQLFFNCPPWHHEKKNCNYIFNYDMV
jgi:hypothetical protein